MFTLSEAIKKEVSKAVKKALETGEENIAIEGGFFLTSNKNQPEGVGFFDQIEEGDKTFYVCQKMI